MQTIIADFETYYDKDYSLRKMTPVEYILDPRYETQGLAVKEGVDAPAFWIDGPDVGKYLAQLPREVMMVTHNALFDMCICAWRYKYVPKLMVDTLGVARATLASRLPSLSLAKVAKHLDLGVKDTQALTNVMGLRFETIKATPGLYDRWRTYGLDDVEMCAGIYRKLVLENKFPASELVVMDSVLRCVVQPQFKLDQNVLSQHLYACQQEKEQLLARAMLAGVNDVSDLMSNQKFAAVLESLGVDPPTKISPTTGNVTYAFAKTDSGMADLREHENIAVQVVVDARLGHKSTLEESRTERMLTISRLDWQELTPQGNNEVAGSWMPIPLRYSGAHTHRLSGEWKLNLQNLPRDSLTKKSMLRRALIAPPGYRVVAVDSSQIEARMVAWLARCIKLLTGFENKQDVYSEFSTEIYDRKITKADTAERFIGKQCILGLGYGLGWEKFGRTIPMLSLNQLGYKIEMPDEDAVRIVNTYRRTYPEIPAVWRTLNGLISSALAGGNEIDFGPITLRHQSILLPSGLELFYDGLHYNDGNWLYSFAGKVKRLYGGSLLENISQALARIVIMDAMVRVRKRLAKYNIHMALQVHDELVYVVREEIAGVVMAIVLDEMTKRPSWAPDLPLAAEGGVGVNYGEAK